MVLRTRYKLLLMGILESSTAVRREVADVMQQAANVVPLPRLQQPLGLRS